MNRFPRLLYPVLVLSILGVPGCFGDSSPASATENATKGAFEALSANMSDGDVWALNRPIRLFFNHPVDMASVSFSSVIIRPTSTAILGRPVAGTFAISETDSAELLFYPACPIIEEDFYPGLYPGGYGYELALPVEAGSGTSVLRDISGKALEIGLARFFVTPTPPSEPLFMDTEIGPPQIVDVFWKDAGDVSGTGADHPSRLNMFSMDREALFIRFDQAVDGNPTNLNTTNLSLSISADTISNQPTGPTFSATVPGVLTLLSNCDGGGALVHFQASGVLPPDRYLRFTVSTDFSDLSGETNSSTQTPVTGDFELPTLQEVYQLANAWPLADVTADEFTEDFSSTLHLDLEAPLGLPLADVDTSGANASFDYPGELVSGNLNFVLNSGIYLEVDTTGTSTGTSTITDSQGDLFEIKDGILEVNNFTLKAGSTFRAVGSNPLVIRANGTVDLDGTLDVSGQHAQSPVALNSPHLPELGAEGECGGGDGGDASYLTNAETLRGEAGDGPFGLYPFQGGGGGESGFQQGLNNPIAGPGGEVAPDPDLEHWVAAGGGGGGFGLGANVAVTWQPVIGVKDGWSPLEWPSMFDNDGPDHRPGWHTALTDPSLRSFGAEPGLRGSSWDSSTAAASPLAGTPIGVYGMEDLTQDETQDDNGLGGGHGFDPAFTDGLNPPIFDVGHPSAGPDPGAAGTSPFTDGDTSNDFYGRRFDPSNEIFIEGEMTAPWAGSGGGAGGDLQWLARNNNGDPDMLMWLDLSDMWPDPLFPYGLPTIDYFKGAPGGGGGGQLQIQAVGPIILRANSSLRANGGMGHGGENILSMGTQVSGSGGGSGGHIILQSATGLDMDEIELGGGGNIANMPEADIIQAIGGRRGWAMSQLNPDATVTGDANALRNGWDGNSQFMVGRGGAGGNGVIQIHVPRPEVNISFDPDWDNAIQNFILDGSGDLQLDNLELILDRYTAPASVCLVPLFSNESVFQSAWVDTGMLGLRNPDGLGGWPKFGESILQFTGTDQDDASVTAGVVKTTNGFLNDGAPLLTGTLGTTGSISGYSFILPGAEALFQAALIPQFTYNPTLLEGYDLEIDDGLNSPVAYGITDALLTSGTLTLSTQVVDGLPPSSGTWTLREKFFRISTSNDKDRLPDTATVLIEFQGAPEGSTPHLPDEGAATAWTTELSEHPGASTGLEGMRFLRYRVTFNISADSGSLTLSSERPKLEILKIPFAW